MQVFYVNIGGGEPTIRADFWELVDYATAHHVGVKFSTNGVRITPEVAARLAASDYVDVQISIDGATAEVNDAVRGEGSFATADRRPWRTWPRRGSAASSCRSSAPATTSPSSTPFKAIADRYGAQLRLTRLRPSGRGADVWDELHPTAAQQRRALRLAAGPRRRRAHRRLVLPPGRLRRIAAGPEPLRRRAGGVSHRSRRRRVRLPVRHPRRLPGRQRPRHAGGFAGVWRESELFRTLRGPQSGGACAACSAYDSCRGGCMAAKFFTGLPLDGPDPECVKGYGELQLANVAPGSAPRLVARPLPAGPGSGRRRTGDAAASPARPGLRREPADRRMTVGR